MKNDLTHLDNTLFDALGGNISSVYKEEETGDYCGYNFQFGTFRVKYRKAKVTPKKLGQFVALWKRNTAGKTEPYHIDDDFDFYFIETVYGHKRGCFIFPKAILSEKQVLSVNNREGKHGFRVYPIWDIPESKQAISTKSWQILYFIDLTENGKTAVEKVQKLMKR